MNVTDKVFFITGGHSGLGSATAQTLSKAGAKVVIADLPTRHEVSSPGIFVPTDVTQEAQVESALAAAIDHYGAIHGVINCAGIAIAKRTVGKSSVHSLEEFQKVIMVNLVGTFNTIRLAAARMRENPTNTDGERGVIINTASVAAFDGQIGQVAYAASKGGVVSMTLPLARELSSWGIRVVTIAPGIFDTPMMAGLPEPAREALGQQVPFPKRLGRPQEYAALVQHIIENVMINGEVIRLDGAIRMAPS